MHLATRSFVFGRAREQIMLGFYFWRRDSRCLFVSDSWYCQIQTTRSIMSHTYILQPLRHFVFQEFKIFVKKIIKKGNCVLIVHIETNILDSISTEGSLLIQHTFYSVAVEIEPPKFSVPSYTWNDIKKVTF